MSTTSEIFKATIFLMSNKVRMTWTREITLLLIIRRTGIVVFEDDSNRRTSSITIENTTLKDRQISLLARSSTLLSTAFSTFNINQKIIYFQWQSSRAAINIHSHGFSVRFAKYGNLKNSSETIHTETPCGDYII